RTLVERVGPVALDAEHSGDGRLTAVEGAYTPAFGSEDGDREPAEEATRAQDRYERRHPRRPLGGADVVAGACGRAIPNESQRSSTRSRTSSLMRATSGHSRG